MKIRRIAFALIAFAILSAPSLSPTPSPTPGSVKHGLDVVIVLPVGVEMKPAIGFTQQKVNQLADAIHRLVPAARLGVVAYSVAAMSPRVLPLTNSLEQQHSFLKSVELDKSGHVSADLSGGIRAAMDMFSESDAKRVIVLFASVGPRDGDLAESLQLAAKFRGEGGTLNVVDATREIGRKWGPRWMLSQEWLMKARENLAEIAKAGGGTMRSISASGEPEPTPWPYGPVSVFVFSSLSIPLAS
jgi:hypothetical protein